MTAEPVEITPLQKKIDDELGKAPPKPEFVLSLIEVATGKVTKVEDLPLNGEVQGFAWSPDGKKIAYAWRQVHEGEPKDRAEKETESFLVVADADGKNAKTIREFTADDTLGRIEWADPKLPETAKPKKN